MLVDEVKKLVEQLAQKSAIGGYLPASEYSNYASLAQLKALNQIYDLLDYNQQIIVLASDVFKTESIQVINGRATRPTDYYKYGTSSALYYENNAWFEEDMEYIGLSERISRKRSRIVTPTTNYPIITEDQIGLIIDPIEVNRISLTYMVDPLTPVWAAVPAVVPPTFDEGNSTDFILSNKFKDFLVKEIAQLFSIEIKDQSLQQSTIQNALTPIR